MLYLLQFFQLREHTCFPDDLPPRGLAPDCDVSDVAAATGKSILIILKSKSKNNIVTLDWKREEKEREMSLNILSFCINHRVMLRNHIFRDNTQAKFKSRRSLSLMLNFILSASFSLS